MFTCSSRTGSMETEIRRESQHPNLSDRAHVFVFFPMSVGVDVEGFLKRRDGQDKKTKLGATAAKHWPNLSRALHAHA